MPARPEGQGSGYKPYIDGLRAVAVLGVLLHHLGLPAPAGGFIGVDVFFVISGYLIFGIIHAEMAEGRFSVAGFYERRVRRILPALLAVTVATSLAAWIFFLPPDFDRFARSVVAAMLFVPNIFFYTQAGYFSPQAETMPLLHYWSLGVEEQFYLVFPLLVMAAARWPLRWTLTAIGTLFMVSLIAAELAVRKDASAAFYLLPFRAFELLAGSAVALAETMRKGRPAWARTSSCVGLVVLAACFLAYDGTTRFPGLSALPPVLGTALVLYGCNTPFNPVSSALGSAGPVLIGRISYSLYLVHWPLIVFAPYVFPEAGKLPLTAGLLAASLIAAFASYHLVEQPFRRARGRVGRRTILTVSSSALAALAAAGVWVASNRGFPGRLDARVDAVLAYDRFDPTEAFRFHRCFLELDQAPSEWDEADCRPTGASRKVVLWGDSVSAHLYSGLSGPLRDSGFSLGQMNASACPPVIDLDVPHRPRCRAFNERAFREILLARPDILIMAAAWDPQPDLLAALERTLDVLAWHGIRPVVLGYQPQFRSSVPSILAGRIRSGNESTMSGPDLISAHAHNVEVPFTAFMRGRSRAHYISMLDLLCDARGCPLYADRDTPMYFDTQHLTPAGSRVVGDLLLRAMASSNILPAIRAL